MKNLFSSKKSTKRLWFIASTIGIVSAPFVVYLEQIYPRFISIPIVLGAVLVAIFEIKE